AAGDSVRALSWIENCAMPLVKRGDLFTLLGWQRLFPTALMRSQPEVTLAIAWGMALAVRYDEALALLGEIERDVGTNHAPDREYLDALRLAERYVGLNSVAAALPASLIAHSRYEQGRLDEAEAMLVDRVSLINAGAMLDCVLSAYFVMARIAVHKMNPERA